MEIDKYTFLPVPASICMLVRGLKSVKIQENQNIIEQPAKDSDEEFFTFPV